MVEKYKAKSTQHKKVLILSHCISVGIFVCLFVGLYLLLATPIFAVFFIDDAFSFQELFSSLVLIALRGFFISTVLLVPGAFFLDYLYKKISHLVFVLILIFTNAAVLFFMPLLLFVIMSIGVTLYWMCYKCVQFFLTQIVRLKVQFKK